MECTICKEETDTIDNPLISPCACTGSVGKTHRRCIEEWVSSSGRDVCTVCNQEYSQRIDYSGPLPEDLINNVNQIGKEIRNTITIAGAFLTTNIMSYSVGVGAWRYFANNPLTFTQLALLKTSCMGVYVVAGFFVGIIRQANINWRGRDYRLNGDKLILPTTNLITVLQFFLAWHHLSFTGWTWSVQLFWYWTLYDCFNTFVLDNFMMWYKQKYFRKIFIDRN